MSIVCSLYQVDGAEINELLANYDITFLDEKEDKIYLDKAWHGIHYLLTSGAFGENESLSYLLVEGEEIGNDVVSARVFSAEQIADFDEVLSEISPDDLRDQFDPEDMLAEGIYPPIWDISSEKDDNLEYLLEHFSRLKAFVHETKEQNQGVIILVGE